MAWTHQQEKAIKTRGKNIIVSAGAGSGKTAVLSERILEYVQSGKDIRKLLILTFTNAAAGEMKERIRSKLLNNGLYEQAELIDVADITTFDAYSLSLVKKYYYRLGLENNIGIIDQALVEIKTSEILDAMFTEKYENDDKLFLELLRKYTTQDDERIKSMILKIRKKLELLVDEKSYIENFEEKYFNNEHLNNLILKYEKLCLDKIKDLVLNIDELLVIAQYEQAKDTFIKSLNNAKKIFETYNDYDDFASKINDIKFPNIYSNASLEAKNLKKLISDSFKELKEKFFGSYLFKQDMVEEILLTKNDILYLLQLCQELDERLFDYKKSLMQFDYGDIAKMAIKLVKDYEDVRDEISNNLEEILIDEYQDTSNIQETFISYISNNNCYMVGDIKQSIYRFRNANPYIFKNKYERYEDGNDGIKIDLTFNFRSRDEVLNNINDIFETLMTNEFGDANYSKDHKMIYGLKTYDSIKQDVNFNMEVLGYNDVEGYSNDVVEAFICGNKIKEIINNKNLCLKKDGYKEVKYSDIAILIDRKDSFLVFKEVFDYLGIPLSIEGDVDLNSSIIPKLFSNILILLERIKNNNFDITYRHALASVSRSFLMELNDEDVYYLLKNNEHPMIEKLRKIALMNISYEELFIKICECFNIYEKLPIIGDVNNSLIVIEYIYNMFKMISNAGMNLEVASQYLYSVFDKQVKLTYKLINDSKDSVRVMTIHKSKGLEFAYCFFPLLGNEFNDSYISEKVGLSNKYGIYIPFSDEGSNNTIIKILEDEEIRREDVSEKIRLFYVALTRAREKMFLISSNKEYSTKYLRRGNYKCFNHMVVSLDFMNDYRVNVEIDELGLTNNLKVEKEISLVESKKINYDDKSYLSSEVVKKRISKELKEMVTPELQRAIDLGLELHECLEVLDFKNIDVDSLNTSNFIKKTLKKLLTHEIFSHISEAKTYHEHEFYLECDQESYHGIIDLLVEYEDHIDIIDYKLSNIDSVEYIHQLNIYRKYVNSISCKPVNCYLLSIIKQEIKKIDIQD